MEKALSSEASGAGEDWVTIAVATVQSSTRQDSRGRNFCSWTLSLLGSIEVGARYANAWPPITRLHVRVWCEGCGGVRSGLVCFAFS